ncbi:hypothetical protein HDU98_011880, partial [Podochytrium sp. JEL0797]
WEGRVVSVGLYRRVCEGCRGEAAAARFVDLWRVWRGEYEFVLFDRGDGVVLPAI